jgi:hypothetical protein
VTTLAHASPRAPRHWQREHDNIRKVEPMYNHFEWDEHAVVAEKLAFQLTEFQRLPIGYEKRGSLVPASSPRALGASLGGGASGGVGLSMSRLGSSGGPSASSLGASQLGAGAGYGGSGVFSGGVSQQQQQQQQYQYQQQQQHFQGGASAQHLPGGMALNPSSSFIGSGGLGGGGGSGSSSISNSQFLLPGLSHGLQDGSYGSSSSSMLSASHLGGSYSGGAGGMGPPPPSAGGGSAARMGLATPGGTTLGSLGPSAAALLAKYGYSSVLGGGGLPPGGSAVPSVLGPAGGAYPMVQGEQRG